jgi:hypothetical protein
MPLGVNRDEAIREAEQAALAAVKPSTTMLQIGGLTR